MNNERAFKLHFIIKHSLHFFLVGLLIFSLSSCTGLLKAKKINEAISYGKVEINLNEHPSDYITFHYTGCSGFLIKYGNQAVLHDPFFSNIGPLFTLNTKTIESDTARIQAFFRSQFPSGKDQKGFIKTLLVSHTHYDHMLDVPYIYNHVLNKDSLLVLGSNDMIKVMKYRTGDNNTSFNHIISVEDQLTDLNTIGKSYYSFDKKIRILPIRTEHAPHFYGMHFYKGHIKKNPKRAPQWKEGTNIAYLIDFLADDGRINFRTYICSAAANTPKGFVPPSVLAQHPVDLAILCVASYAYVKDYPFQHLENLNPKHIILSHWENFFQSKTKLDQNPMIVPFTNVKAFLKRVDEASKGLSYSPKWTMPNPGAEITFGF